MPVNKEKLEKLQSARIGGKGTSRRKKKIVHKTATDDKKVQVRQFYIKCILNVSMPFTVGDCVLIELFEEAWSEQHPGNRGGQHDQR